MKLLVLGGTGFLGRVFVETALERGHQLTLFNRGQRNPDLFQGIDQIRGYRTIDVSALFGRTWDAVVDTSGYVPRIVQMSAAALQGSVGRYLFISSISVYKRFDLADQDEEAEIAAIADPTTEAVTGETYGALKGLCEQVVQSAYGDQALIVRPGLIVGRHDATDRFTYWAERMTRGGEVLVPDLKNQPVQIIDVRDLAEWCLSLLENEANGTYNAVGPTHPYRLEDVLRACAEGNPAKLTWVKPEFLKSKEVQAWSELPLVMELDGTSDGFSQFNNSRAIGAGLKFRSLSSTICDTVTYALSRPPDYLWKAGLSVEREEALLREWHEIVG